jgi:D-amino peptidase
VRVVLSVDMEGVSQLRDPHELFACRSEYWQTGKAWIEADTLAAVEGLIAGGADDVVVLDNHGSGNPQNVSAECLPPAAHLETWHVFDLPGKGVDAMLQLGYHSRGGGEGFTAHTYVPGLRLRAGDELVSESHGRAWAARVPLIGIVGNDTHSRTLGSLADTPYLVVQRTVRGDLAEPVYAVDEGLDAIRAFARDAARRIGDTPAPAVPRDVVFAASMPNGAEQADTMAAAGWRRTGDVEYEAHLAGWSDARPLIAAAMSAALAPLRPFFDGATSAEEAAALDAARVARLSELVDRWCGGTHPEWYTGPGDEFGLHG